MGQGATLQILHFRQGFPFQKCHDCNHFPGFLRALKAQSVTWWWFSDNLHPSLCHFPPPFPSNPPVTVRAPNRVRFLKKEQQEKQIHTNAKDCWLELSSPPGLSHASQGHCPRLESFQRNKGIISTVSTGVEQEPADCPLAQGSANP